MKLGLLIVAIFLDSVYITILCWLPSPFKIYTFISDWKIITTKEIVLKVFIEITNFFIEKILLDSY